MLAGRGGTVVCVCVCQCGGWGRGWVCVFVCQINYLNPPTIKAEICYQRPPLEARVSALLSQYAPHLFPPSALSVGPDKDHKLWILNTHPSRTKTNRARLWPRDSCAQTSSSGAYEYFEGGRLWCKMLMKCHLCLESLGVFNLHDVVMSLRWCVTWGWRVWSVYNGGCLFYTYCRCVFQERASWQCMMGYLLGPWALYSHLVPPSL